MMAETGCDGVVVGRGCLGKPWLFGDLAAALGVEHRADDHTEDRADFGAGSGTMPRVRPTLGQVGAAFRRHAELLVEFYGDDPQGGEHRGCRDIRKHVAWYFKGYAVGGELRAALATSSSLQQIDDLLAQLDWMQPYPGADAEGQRGRAGTPKVPSLPDRWLDSRELQETHRAELTEAELSHSGG
jgi:tRNA-dihydrouridine synthase